jgi:hypothetical protein
MVPMLLLACAVCSNAQSQLSLALCTGRRMTTEARLKDLGSAELHQPALRIRISKINCSLEPAACLVVVLCYSLAVMIENADVCHCISVGGLCLCFR